MSILWNPTEAVDLLEMPLPLITEGTQNMGNGVYWLKAGTPLDSYFAVANDEDAMYVVAEDFYFYSNKPDQAKVVPLITAGYVDINKAEAASGITYSQDCIDALMDAGIVLVDGTLPSSGGGGATIVHSVLTGADAGSLDMTAGAIMAAAQTGPVILLETLTGYGTVAAGPVFIYMNESGAFNITGISPNVSMYSAASADAYPSANGSSDGDDPGSM